MSTKNPRVMVVLENPLMKWVKKMAKSEGVSISFKLRDFVREAYENYEDRYWSHQAEERLRSFKPSKAISHDEFWKKAGV